MSFTRTGSPEPLQTLKFKCFQCGQETLHLLNGRCQNCNSQESATKISKILEKLNKKQRRSKQ